MPNNSEHAQRSHKVCTRPSGKLVVPDAFSVILAKVRAFSAIRMYIKTFAPQGTRMTEDAEFRCSLHRESSQLSTLNRTSQEILCYRGKVKRPRWKDSEMGALSLLLLLCSLLWY
jgi:hypothetical protein